MHSACPSRDSQRDGDAHVVTAQGCRPSTHMGMGGQGARTHRTDCRSQYWFSGQTFPSHVGAAPSLGAPWPGASEEGAFSEDASPSAASSDEALSADAGEAFA